MTIRTLNAKWSGAVRPLRFLRAFLQQAEVARSRKALLKLDDHLLRDIGLTRHEADVEATRPSWDAPRHWRL